MRIVPRLLARLLAALAAISLTAQPVAAQEEGLSILRDAETEALLQELVAPITRAAGLAPNAVQVVLVNDSSINAFVAGGQRIYVNSGLINAADSANEVQGVLAHEMGHIIGGHSISIYDGANKSMKIQLLSMLAGLAAALAGAPEAGMAVSQLGQQAALGKFLAFSRAQESSADAASVQLLSRACISGKGSIAFFHKLQSQEFRYAVPQDDETAFSSTHPMTGDRIANLQADFEKDPAWDRPPADLVAGVGRDGRACPAYAADTEDRFQRIKGKLYGYLAKPEDTLRHYPVYLTGVPARYARAYAYHKDARMDEALGEVAALLANAPDDPYFLELKGQVLLESGRPVEALAPLRRATQLTGNNPLIASTFGHALIATEDAAHNDEAEQVLRAALSRDRENPFAWYQLGVVYGAKGDLPRARLASAEQQIMSAQPRAALQNAEFAENALPSGTPDWLRAQDVAMEARAELERTRGRQ
jgi:predicted Zn-dependent protease